LSLNPISAPIVIGTTNGLSGTGFTAGSVIVLFVAAPGGAVAFGPFTPAAQTSTTLTWVPPASVPLGNGFGTVVVVNTDQGFLQSNPQSQLLFGAVSANIPTILTIDGVALTPADPAVPLALVETVIVPGATATLTGTGFNGALVNLFTPTGNLGPLVPLPGATASQLQVAVPANAPTGPGTFQVVNSPYSGNVLSNAVSVVIGATLSISAVSQNGTVVTVTGTGFAPVSVINLFNQQGQAVVNLGGLDANGSPRIPLTVPSSTELSFTVPAAAVSGPAYVQVLNPPYVGYTSSDGDPDGAFTLVVP
jgi:hypothetical protein